jgi:hypothetical protein
VHLALRILRDRPLHVLGLAAVVFGGTAMMQAFVEVKVADGSFSAEVEALAYIVTGVIAAFGFVLYAGLLDFVVGAYHRGEPDPTVREVIHKLPHGRLVIADFVLVVVCGVLAVFLVVPGLIALTFFCLVGPVIVTEEHTVVDGFRRSARLVRPHFWMVLFVVTIPLLIEDSILHGVDVNIIDSRVLDEFIITALLGAVVGSIVGLVEVVLTHEFRQRDPLPELDRGV